MEDNKSVAENLIKKRFNRDVKIKENDIPDEILSILSYGSCRNFSSELISPQTLELLYYAAFSAPSKSDLQQCDIVEVSDGEILDKMAKLIPTMKWVENAPLILIFCGNGSRIREICKLQNKEFRNEHFDSFVNPVVDASLVMMNFIRAANALNLGTCPISHIRNNASAISTLLKIPENNFILNGLAVGIPKQEKKIKMRLPLEITVHKNQYNDRNIQFLLEDYDNDKINNGEFSNKERNPEKFQPVKKYGWLEDKSRQFSQTEREDYHKYLKSQEIPI